MPIMRMRNGQDISGKPPRTRNRVDYGRIQQWLKLDYLIVAGGGGGGGGWEGGGGGAGGLINKEKQAIGIGEYAVVVGSGGIGAKPTSYNSTNGGNSKFNGETAIGGGGGAGEGSAGTTAKSGGSGGGGSQGGYPNGASGTSGQGNAGGNGYAAPDYSGGGGGGANAAGTNSTSSAGGAGGAGLSLSITGASVGYAGGGGGSIRSGTQGTATHGGGNACSPDGIAATANTGGGGGAGAGGYGGNGGTGVVILRYKTACGLYFQGGTVTYDGDYTVRKFTKSNMLRIGKKPLPPVNDALELVDAAALICTLSGRSYFKRNDGFAIAAYWRNVAGGDYTGPMLISTVAANVTYYTTYDYADQTYLGSVVYNGVTYYYSNTEQFMGGNPSDDSGTGRIRLTATELSAAVTELLDRYYLNGY